jgi:hypothetical protein
MSFLKGKPQKQSSENVNNAYIKSQYGGMIGQGAGATNYLSSLLTGTGDTGAANAGLQGYYANAGYAPAMRQLSQQITGQGAASGLLRSGATAKALETRGAELNQSFFNNYLQQLAGLSGLGLQAGGLVANTGQKSTGTGPQASTAGTIASIAGSLASIFSDRRLKDDIELIDREPDGLGIYGFRYKGAVKRWVGVMADEVAKLRPHALGPKIAGFDTVNYGKL